MADEQPELDEVEAHVGRVLASRRKANASGQRGEDVQNIRAAHPGYPLPVGQTWKPCPECDGKGKLGTDKDGEFINVIRRPGEE